jgi:hypothetical protein
VPTVLRVKGFRIGFYSSEPDEPAHVLSWNKGYREAELREIARILATHEAKLIESWNETE